MILYGESRTEQTADNLCSQTGKLRKVDIFKVLQGYSLLAYCVQSTAKLVFKTQELKVMDSYCTCQKAG